MKEATEQNVVAEAPKTKQGTKKATTTTDTQPESAAARAPRLTENTRFRLLSGVEPESFRGQRQIVVKALKSLGHGEHTIADVAAKAEGLVSKTPVEASVKYHLNGLANDGKVEKINPPVEKKEEAVAATATA